MYSSNWSDPNWMVFWGKEVGINCGMIVGIISVTVAAYLMYQKGWRDSDDDY